jgi:hypothetical protein
MRAMEKMGRKKRDTGAKIKQKGAFATDTSLFFFGVRRYRISLNLPFRVFDASAKKF